VGQAGLYAAWLSGVPRFDPVSGKDVASSVELPYRPRQVLHYNNRYGIQADVLVDISDVWDEKVALIKCFSTQFGAGPRSQKKSFQTRLSSEQFEESLRGTHAFYGHQAGVRYAEAYCSKVPWVLKDVSQLIEKVKR
jgi:hypothetical protein